MNRCSFINKRTFNISVALTFAPFDNNFSTISNAPLCDAICRGVNLELSKTFGLAPSSRRIVTISGDATSHAKCKGVLSNSNKHLSCPMSLGYTH